MTEAVFRYEAPFAFRTALKERFGRIARSDQRYSLDELQRQFSYDRALARLFSSDDADRWVLKGAGALLARLTIARHSKDIDVFFNATDADVDDAVTALRAALRIDLGDYFSSTSPESHRSKRRPRELVCMSPHDSALRRHRPSRQPSLRSGAQRDRKRDMESRNTGMGLTLTATVSALPRVD